MRDRIKTKVFDKKMKENTLSDLINICQGLEYDFAVITGDIIDCKVENIKDKLQILNSLSVIKPVYYISGNHDVFYGLEDLKKELTSFIFMDNNHFS